jgi:hypothetical protein
VFEYASVPDDMNTLSDDVPFYTRNLHVPIVLTVQRPLHVSNFRTIPLPPKDTSGAPVLSSISKNPLFRDLTRALSVSDLLVDGNNSKGSAEYLIQTLDTSSLDGNLWCLVTFDLRNMSSRPFDIEFNSYGGIYFETQWFSFFLILSIIRPRRKNFG